MEEVDRFRGCLVGLVVGDALGTTMEMMQAAGVEPIDDIVGGGPYQVEPGHWTDPASMGLCLAASLVEHPESDLKDQVQRYVNWYRNGYMTSAGRCWDLETYMRVSLQKFERTGDPLCGQMNPDSASNPPLARLAAVPMRYAGNPDLAIDKAAESARTTHPATVSVDATRYFAGLIVGALRGVDRDTLLSARYHPVRGSWGVGELCPEIDEVAAGSFKVKDPPDIEAVLMAHTSLEAALWGLYHGSDFRDGALKVANLGDDSDTTTAMYGQLAGALYGYNAIPESWLAILARRDLVVSLADQLYRLSQEG